MNPAVFLEAAGTVLKIGSCLKPNHHWEIKLDQIREMLCTMSKKGLDLHVYKPLLQFKRGKQVWSCTFKLELKNLSMKIFKTEFYAEQIITSE